MNFLNVLFFFKTFSIYFPKNKKMEKIKINIPDTSFKKDFTIIYKGREKKENEKTDENQYFERIEEIKTSKEELLRKLRYFKRRESEINQMNEIFIHDSYSVNHFKEFIDTLESHEIEINDDNIDEFLELSHKYEYTELEQELSTFSMTRPDIHTIITKNKVDEIDQRKEEKLSKHLDICLHNSNFINFPLPVLARILNSPERVVHDHHLLFEFVHKVIEKYKTDTKEIEKKSECDEETRMNLEILLSCLDYNEMTNEELDTMMNEDEMMSIFNARHLKERMKKLIEEERKQKIRYSTIEARLATLERQHSEYEQQMQLCLNENLRSMKEKIEQQEKIISESHEKQEKQEQRINELEDRLRHFDENQNESHMSINESIRSMKIKISEQENKLKQYFEEKELLARTLTEKTKKLEYMETKIALRGRINAVVNSNQTIEGSINVESLNEIDSTRSKYIINTNKSETLGENEYRSGTKITSYNQHFSFAKTPGTYILHALIADKLGHIQEITSDPLTVRIDKYKFKYTGRVQAVRLLPGKYKLEVWGSSGGENYQTCHNCSYSGHAGKGGYSTGTLTLSQETTLYVYVGGSSKSSSGGWNGGGKANPTGPGGGGSTDISLYGNEGSTEWNTADHLYSRLIVAGGGGGSSHTNHPECYGGSGGGSNGETSGHGNQGGTQTSGYQFGIGEDSTTNGSESGGGGGGWYGGRAYTGGGWCPGGGGGSGFVYSSSTASNYPSGCKLSSSFYLTNSQTISGKNEIPTTSGSGTERGHSGNGYALITLQ